MGILPTLWPHQTSTQSSCHSLPAYWVNAVPGEPWKGCGLDSEAVASAVLPDLEVADDTYRRFDSS